MSFYQQIKNLTPAEKFVFGLETRLIILALIVGAAKTRKRKEQEHGKHRQVQRQ